MPEQCAVILAAGEGKRMKSDAPKVLSPVLFKPMLSWVIDSVKKAEINKVCVVAGFRHELVESYLKQNSPFCQTVLQLERKGTGHAVQTASSFLKNSLKDDVLILNGDAPFIDSQTIKDAYQLHKEQKNAATVISAALDNPFGYGRIVRDERNGTVQSIIEQKDANSDIQQIKEVNSGAYWFRVSSLLSVLENLSNDNAQGEYYLPDTLKLLLRKGERIGAYLAPSADLVLGANDCLQLHQLECIARRKILTSLMKSGVRIPASDGVLIGPDVTVQPGACILPGTIICGRTTIGSGSVIGPNSQVIDSAIGKRAVVNAVYCKNSFIQDEQTVGPFVSILNNNDAFANQF